MTIKLDSALSICGSSLKSDLNINIRNSFSNTLTTMKVAHFKAYFETRCKDANAEYIFLPCLFSSFAPCPFKLTILELCKIRSLTQKELPEFLTEYTEEFFTLYQSFQKLDPSEKMRLFHKIVHEIDLFDHAQIEGELEFVSSKAIRSLQTSNTLLSLLDCFYADIKLAKKLMDCLSKSEKEQERPSLSKEKDSTLSSAEFLLMRKLYSVISAGNLSITSDPFFKKYASELIHLKEKFNSLSSYSKYLLEKDCGFFKIRHDSDAEAIFTKIRTITSEIIGSNRDLFRDLESANQFAPSA